MTSQTTTGCQK